MADASDPAGKGVNMVITPDLDLSRAPEATIDPNTGEAVSPQAKVREFIHDLGVGLPPPNAVLFNDRLGLLMVRRTPEEIEIVEDAVGRGSPTPSIPFKESNEMKPRTKVKLDTPVSKARRSARS